MASDRFEGPGGQDHAAASETEKQRRLQTADQLEFAGAQELFASERHLKRYNLAVAKMLSKHLTSRTEILEFGAGIGALAKLWDQQYGVKPECLEIDPALRRVLAERGFRTYAGASEISKTYQGIYTSNVLEHIEDDLSALRGMHALLQPGARLIVYVPAFMCLFSEHDSSVGHYRRYEKAELLEKVSAANFKIVHSSYVDSLGFFASLAVRILGYKGKSQLGNARSLLIYDKFVFPLSSLLDRIGFRYLLGKNLLVVAERA